MEWIDTLSTCLKRLPKNPVIALHSALAEPLLLAEELANHAEHLAGATIYTMFPMGPAPYAQRSEFKLHTFVPGSAMQAAVNEGRAIAHRYPLSHLPGLFEGDPTRPGIKVDLLLLQLEE